MIARIRQHCGGAQWIGLSHRRKVVSQGCHHPGQQTILLAGAESTGQHHDLSFRIDSGDAGIALHHAMTGLHHRRVGIGEIGFQLLALAIQAWFEVGQRRANLLAITGQGFDLLALAH